MIRQMTTPRTKIAPVSPGSTIGKSRRKLVPDAIELSDLGCHAFDNSPIPAGRKILSHTLSPRVKVVL